ncbi:YHS domain-containing protein [Pedobacter nototheniae]|uniref:YHS domain-containing protein n=1 Tax=Pedobacter nototheniae TaxID=2488994 RepID=UPI00292E9E81|nr:YHS domain-containing protein [Pedobacter nototheniae]
MKRLIITTLIALVAMLTLKATENHFTNPDTPLTDTLKKEGIDPVCKMKVKAGSTKTVVYNKVVYGFCSESCKQKFVKEPVKYTKN